MSFEYIQKLPTPDEIREEFPLTKELAEIKKERDQQIADVFTGKSDKFLVIVGPCSADNEDAVCDYVSRLGKVNEKVKDKLILIPRIYTNKPRTTGEGYKGITSQPDPEGKTDFHAGLIAMRHMQIKAIEESGLTAADEMLYPENWGYVADILSYVAIGARSVEDQEHRMTELVAGFSEYYKIGRFSSLVAELVKDVNFLESDLLRQHYQEAHRALKESLNAQWEAAGRKERETVGDILRVLNERLDTVAKFLSNKYQV